MIQSVQYIFFHPNDVTYKQYSTSVWAIWAIYQNFYSAIELLIIVYDVERNNALPSVLNFLN